MNKNLKRVLIVLFDIILISTLFLNVVCYAGGNVKQFSGSTSLLGSTNAKNATVGILGTILTITRTVGAAVAIGILMIIGCKYLMASAGDRADIKKHAIAYVVGAVVLFGATNIIAALIAFTDQVVK